MTMYCVICHMPCEKSYTFEWEYESPEVAAVHNKAYQGVGLCDGCYERVLTGEFQPSEFLR